MNSVKFQNTKSTRTNQLHFYTSNEQPKKIIKKIIPFTVLLCCSASKSHPTLCDPMDCSAPGFPVLHYPLEFAQTHVHWIGDAVQPSHPLSSPSPTFNSSQHQGLFQWVSSLHQVAKVLEFQFQHQSFQWIIRTDFLQDGLVWSPCSPRDSLRVFSNTTVQKHQFFGAYLSL